MKRILLSVILALPLLASCTIIPNRMVLNPDETSWFTEAPYIITEHKYSSIGEEMPAWVIAYIDGGIAEVEALTAYQSCHVFVARNEGNNFSAMKRWMEGFSTGLDFPRLAAARVEARFYSAAPLPDQEYGAYFEALVRTASDYPWTGAVRTDDFWIRKNYLPAGEEGEREAWEFLILLNIDRMIFFSQLETVFRNVEPNPLPAKDQINAYNRVKERFYDGF